MCSLVLGNGVVKSSSQPAWYDAQAHIHTILFSSMFCTGNWFHHQKTHRHTTHRTENIEHHHFIFTQKESKLSVAAALRKPSSEQGRFGMLGRSNPEQSRRLPMYQARITPAHQTLPTKLACYTKYIQDIQLTQPQNIKPVIFKSGKYPTLFYFALLQKCCFDCWSFASHLTSRPFHSYAYAYVPYQYPCICTLSNSYIK